MDSKTDFATIIVAICVAGYAAIMLACLAHDLGLPDARIRYLSMTGALFLALPVALDLLRSRSDRIG